MKTYRVKFTVTVVEEVEADSMEEAEQVFSELWNGPEDIVDQGMYIVEEL